MDRLIKNPLLHCLIIGLLVTIISQLMPQQTTISFHHSEITEFQKELSQSLNSNSIDFNRSAQLLAEQEILFLEAKKSGLDNVDSVILRLANIAEFLQLADAEQSLDEKYEAALAMRLDETDIIVRRQMISIYQAALRNSSPSYTPSDDDIIDWYQQHQSSFIDAPKYAFSHIYLSADQPHSDSASATYLLGKLRSEFSMIQYTDSTTASLNANTLSKAKLSEAIALGDVFYGGHHFNLQSEHSIAKRFGQSFTNELANIAQQQWSAPISSAFGLHFIWLNEKRHAALRPFKDVKQQIINDLKRTAKQHYYKEKIIKLKNNYRLLIEDERGNQSALALTGPDTNND